jgi:hypothetical protein
METIPCPILAEMIGASDLLELAIPDGIKAKGVSKALSCTKREIEMIQTSLNVK